jgi:hypothetical protein
MDRIRVTPEELTTAAEVWLTVMPRFVWKELEAFYLTDDPRKRGSKPDARIAVAAHIVEHFKMAKWEVTRPDVNTAGSPHGR